ncbi:MAG: CBS domain-containing protein [Phycisphaerales bacterium JB040]
MGSQRVAIEETPEARRSFQRRLVRDLDALGRMIEEGMFDTGPRRIGAEQELCLIDERGAPAPVAPELLERIDDERIVPELARFNLEINGSPRELTGRCFGDMRREFDELLDVIRAAAEPLGVRPVLVGILPSASLEHLRPENITPLARYHALDRRLTEMRGGSHPLHIRGTDEISITHDSIMTEAVNTSFQVHLQVSPGEFALAHNVAQLVAAPVLAVSTNAPFYLGRRLWSETRIPIFEQTVDTRRPEFHERRDIGRVRFGERWAGSLLDLYRDDVALLRSVCIDTGEEDSLAELDAGRIPRLHALGMHNSTIYRWNRACYGINDVGGRPTPHLRIENRVLPAGPSTIDEVATSAFWIGLMLYGLAAWPDLTERMDFDDARANFTAAARRGLRTKVQWLDGEAHAMDRLVLDSLLPHAAEGLAHAGVHEGQACDLLDIVSARVASGRTGSQWLLGAVRARGGANASNLRAVTSALADLQASGHSINDWPEPREHPGDTHHEDLSAMTVDEAMTRLLVTARPDDLAAFAHRLMVWQRIHQAPVEDDDHRLLGVMEARAFERLPEEARATATVGELMREPRPCVEAGTLVPGVVRVLEESGLDAVPVVADGRLVGIFTRTDLRRLTEPAGRERDAV